MPIFSIRSSAVDVADVGHAAVAVGGGAGGIKLGRDPHAFAMAALQLVGIDAVGQIAGHQRLEPGARRRTDPLAIGARRLDRSHRRHQIGHDDRPRELPRAVGRHRLQHRPVAQVQVPVVGAADGQALRLHGRLLS
jgi:hypothetical protein